VLMQHEIDAGVQWCAACDRFGWHTFCGQCGRRYRGADLDWRECPSCKTIVPTDFCGLCGDEVMSDWFRAFEAGEIDMEAETAMAKGLLELFYKARPDTAPEVYRETTLGEALMETFGAH